MTSLRYLLVALCALACEREPAPPPALASPTLPASSDRAPTRVEAPNFEAAQLLDGIRRVGVDSIVRRMDEEEGLGDRVLKGISSGDSTWLEVAVALQPTSSAELAESLTGSMADALPRAPEHVLGIIARGAFATADICNMPFFNQPDSVREAYYAATVRALAGVQREALIAERDRCRVELDRIHRS